MEQEGHTGEKDVTGRSQVEKVEQEGHTGGKRENR